MSATFTANASVINGWQLYRMTSTITNTISGLSYNSTTGEFTFPAGSFVLFTQITTPGTYPWGLGYQSSASASTPTSIYDPASLDNWICNTNVAQGIASSLNHIYIFTTSNPVRMYFYSNGGSMTLTQSNVSILQL